VAFIAEDSIDIAVIFLSDAQLVAELPDIILDDRIHYDHFHVRYTESSP
jgi:hypothetical protein